MIQARNCPNCTLEFHRKLPVDGVFCSRWCSTYFKKPESLKTPRKNFTGRYRVADSKEPGPRPLWNTLINRICVQCSTEFQRKAGQCDAPRHKGIYCSRSCASKGKQFGPANPNWKGGVSKNHMRYKRRFVEKFPDKVKVHQLVQSAKNSGLLVPGPCAQCEAPSSFTHAHHEDYTKPLEVTWLCQLCHNRHHHLGAKRA